MKRLRATGGYVPIQPKSAPVVSTSTTVGTESRRNAASSVVMPINTQSPVSGNPGNAYSVLSLPPGPMTAMDLSSSPIVVSAAETCQPSQSRVSVVPQTESTSSFIAGMGLTQLVRSSVNMVTQNQLPLSAIVPQIASIPQVNSSNIFNTNAVRTPEQSSRVFQTVPSTTMVPPVTMVTSSPFPQFVTGLTSSLNFSSATITPQDFNVDPGSYFGTSSDLFQSDFSTGESSTERRNDVLSNDLSQRALLFGDVNFPVLPENLRVGNYRMSNSIANVSGKYNSRNC